MSQLAHLLIASVSISAAAAVFGALAARAYFIKRAPAVGPMVERLQLKPGDTLVVRSDRFITRQQRADLLSYVSANIPAGIKVLVFRGDINLTVLSPEGETE